eukprot:comp21368_c0_seq1/m.29365 comp21368_c0_seq1/g.29365  ORF comp21368_c0_seq1/g.29365 comp21368_c0_seq1/m.29365 type:complete len:657 (-) comp21368_c0_seq1:309-2279(-)
MRLCIKALGLGAACAAAVFADDILHNKIYRQLDSLTNNFCWRLLSDQGEAGCQSGSSGTGGPAYLINSNEALSRFLDKVEGGPYAAVIDSSLLTRDSFDLIAKSGHANSIYVIKGNNSAGFSPSPKSPNALKGLYYNDPTKQAAWNAQGGGENFGNVNMPLLLVENASDIAYMLQTSVPNIDDQGNPTTYPLFAAETNSWMSGALDAATCLRRRLCDPLGSWNVWASTKPLQNKEKIIMGVATLDSTSLFKSRAYGAASAVASFVTLLMAAEALGKIPAGEQAPTNIVFALFNGEAYEYIGSSRFAVDMDAGKFPGIAGVTISPSEIVGIVEVGQVASRGDSSNPTPLYLHRDPVAASQGATNQLLSTIQQASTSAGVTSQPAADQNLLPPASLQSFLRWADRNIPGVVISDHDSTGFANKYYQSFMDNGANIGISDPKAITNLCNVATTVARSLYLAAGGSQPSSNKITANCTNLQGMLEGAVTAMNNSYMQALYKGSGQCEDAVQGFNMPVGLYVGVFNSNGPPCISSAYISYLSLAKSLGTPIANTTADQSGADNCTDHMQGRVATSGQCFSSSVNMTGAYSPGIASYQVVNTSFSTWVESRWDTGTPSARTYFVSSRGEDLTTLGAGIAVLAVSVGLTVVGKRHMKNTFKQE